jgi:hypothetical protein
MPERGSSDPCAAGASAPVGNAPTSPAPTANSSYFTFKEFLSKEEEAAFFDWDHGAQVDKVAAYLAFVAEQPAAAQFTSSRRASTSWAEFSTNSTTSEVHASVMNDLLDGRTKSGFGAFGSEDGYLPQKELSLAVARSIEPIGHEYAIERTKTGEIRPRVLNSRSFYLNWCHAEKQKLMDIRLKLDRLVGDRAQRRHYWERLIVCVDRTMCADCINYAHNLAVDEQARITVRDPTHVRQFPPNKHDTITLEASFTD